MQINTLSKTKTAAVTIIVLLMASVTLMAMTVQPVQAQDDSGDTYDFTVAHGYLNPQSIFSKPLPAGVTADFTQATIAYLSFTPDPIGVNQELLVNMWVSPNAHGGRAFSEYNVVFTKPDGTTDTVTKRSFVGDATSFFNYVVDQAGTWQIEFDFPGGYFAAGNYTTPIGTFQGVYVTNNFLQSVYYSPSQDGPYNFTVQNDFVWSWPSAPLPTDYWTRPVSVMNREWKSILGWYPATGLYGDFGEGTNPYVSSDGVDIVPYVQAPNSAHILWKRQDNFASGIIGGPLGQYTATGGGSNPTIVYSGNMYRTVTKYFNGVSTSVWQCSDLRTGEIHWEQVLPSGVSAPSWVVYQNPGPASAVAYATQSSGENIYLANIVNAGTTANPNYRLIYRNPSTGAVSQNVSISPLTSGTLYKIADWPYFLTVQNLGNSVPVAERYRLINWTVYGTISSSVTYSGAKLQVMNNISWPLSSLPGNTDFNSGYAVTTATAETSNATGIVTNQRILVYSIFTGALVQNFTTDIGTHHFQSGSSLTVDHGKLAVSFTDGRMHCWDCATGQHLWASELKTDLTLWPWETFYEYGHATYGGNLVIGTYAGVEAIDWDTGKQVFMAQSKAVANFESPYRGYNPFFTGNTMADGKIYAYSSEHTPSQPIPRTWGLHCFNATDGELIWEIRGGLNVGAIADGYLTSSSNYDGYMYVIGKGPSATTVTAPDVSVPLGTAFTIKGTVFDMSPAQIGTPCVSKDSMQTQMEYLHMQQPVTGLYQNETAIGVPVQLLAMASDGTYTDLGTVTTNGFYGTFSKAWTPETEGTYTIIASFAADDSYGSSSAATAVTVGPAPEPIEFPPENEPVDNTMLLYGILAAAVIAIVLALIAVLAIFRKH